MGSDILFRPARRLGDKCDIPFRIDGVGFGVAGLLEARKSSEVRKVATLLGLHRLHGTIATFDEQALTARLFHQREAAPILGELVKRWMNSSSAKDAKAASRRISSSLTRTSPGHRKQAVQRRHY